MSSPDVLVIGGGISGLSTAWWLAQQGTQVEVWEADERAGGKIRTHKENGYLIEQSASMCVNHRPQIDYLLTKTHLNEEVRLRDKTLNRYLLHQDQLKPVPMRLIPLMFSPLWSTRAKLRLLSEPFIPKSRKNETVSEFVQRRLGKEILESFIEPFVSATLASDPDLAEARAVLPRLTELENRYGSVAVGMLLNSLLKRRTANKADSFSFNGGMSTLISALADDSRISLSCGANVTSVTRRGDGWQVHACINGVSRSLTVPQVVFSTPAYISGHLLKGIDKKLADLLLGIKYASVAVLHFGIKRKNISHPLDGSGFLVARNSRLRLNGNIWMSRLFAERAPQDYALLSSYLGGSRNPHQLELSDEQLADTSMRDLVPLLGLKGTVDYQRVDRHFKALPLYYGHHQARLRAIDQQLLLFPGLNLNGNFQGGVSIRERIYLGKVLADKIQYALRTDANHCARLQAEYAPG